MLYVLSLLVENKAGVLSRVSNLFARRGFNIKSLAVGETNLPELSRITITVNVESWQMVQIRKQLYKMPDVLMVRQLKDGEHVARELVFIKVACNASRRGEVIQIADIFRAHIVDVATESLTIELSGNADKISALTALLVPYGILELVRTGTIAIERGLERMNIDELSRPREADEDEEEAWHEVPAISDPLP
ncbi:MAG: acetolactate synthase small subunit [Bacillota bacterium]|nr:acetolactate synthase small subunit [Bacillota bacterium]